jgi:hypothetical protein
MIAEPSAKANGKNDRREGAEFTDLSTRLRAA